MAFELQSSIFTPSHNECTSCLGVESPSFVWSESSLWSSLPSKVYDHLIVHQPVLIGICQQHPIARTACWYLDLNSSTAALSHGPEPSWECFNVALITREASSPIRQIVSPGNTAPVWSTAWACPSIECCPTHLAFKDSLRFPNGWSLIAIPSSTLLRNLIVYQSHDIWFLWGFLSRLQHACQFYASYLSFRELRLWLMLTSYLYLSSYSFEH